MRVEVKIITNAFKIFGFFPLEKMSKTRKLYAFFTTGLLLILLCGVCTETYFWNEESGSRILPITYVLCTIYALTKRWSIFHCKTTIKELMEYIGNPFHYMDEKMNYESISIELVLLMNRVLMYLHFMLFFSGIISPFSSLFFGQGLMFSRIMYPIFVPWEVDNLVKYALTYLLEALLVYPSLAGIYSYTIFIIFTTTTFKNEMGKVQKAIGSLEMRTKKNLASEYMKMMKKNVHFGNIALQYDDIYFKNLRECVIHYQKIKRNFEVFASWYNIFFSVELLESTTTICLLFYCTIKMSDMSLILNLLSLCFHLVTSLFLRCYIGEYFKKMNEDVIKTLYDMSWYEQPKSIGRILMIFQGQVMRPMILHGFNHFEASYHTFAYISRISYSYCNVLLT